MDKKWQRLIWSAPVAPKLRGVSVRGTPLQVLSFQYKAAKPNLHQSIIDMAMNGSGCRDTARVLDISLNTVLRHLKNWDRATKLMSSGHSFVVRAILAGFSMRMAAFEIGFLLMSLALEMH